MSFIFGIIIVVKLALAHSDTRHPDAVTIFDCQFNAPWDVNFDNWPDYWKRSLGPRFPHYVVVKIGDDAVEAENRALEVKVDGGGAHLESPWVTVSSNFSYKAECRVRTSSVRFSRSRFCVEFCDDERRVLQTESTEWFAGSDDWATLHIGPINPTNPSIAAARLVLHVEPGNRADLGGRVWWDDVWMARLPQMSVKSSSPSNVYTDRSDIEVKCELSGILDSDPEILFELLDASSQRLDGSRVQLDGRLITERRSRASDFVGVTESQRAAYAGETTWRPPIRKHGFYKIRVTMQNSRGMFDRRVVNVALVPPLDRPSRGEFGWSLADDDIPMPLDELVQLLPRVAVRWVKMPIWYSESDAGRGDALAMFAEKGSASNVEVVGVVDRPPPDSELARRMADDASIADVLLTDAAGWLPLLDPVLTRLAMRVRWWQLGADRDASLTQLPQLDRQVTALREKLFRFGQDVNVGLCWKWLQQAPEATPPPWEFKQYFADPALTGEELAAYLALPEREDVQQWVLVEPLSRLEYDLETRARDLVEQMLAAKIHGADVIFASQPFDDDRGLMTDAGMPGELLLPWRTTASLLSGTRYLGSFQLPRHSHNRLFETAEGDVLMVVWSDQAAEEIVQFGENIRVLDVWGREQAPRRQEGRQIIQVGTLPKFVLGLNPAIARWGMAVRYTAAHVPSVFGKAHPNRIELQNTFSQGVGVAVELVAPKGWQISPRRIDFKLAAGEVAVKAFDVSLPFDASSGPAPLRADFVVDADRQYRFSIDRELIVGDGQIELETTTRLDDDGSLIVEQRMVNHSPTLVDFKCLLYAPGRRRQRVQVFRLGSGSDTKTYHYPEGAQLLGAELWLRAEEVNGSRVLNHRFIVEQ